MIAKGTHHVTDPIVHSAGLNFTYRTEVAARQVLFDINLDIMPGEVVLLMGPSGCGKTTLLSLIGGLRTVTEGTVNVLGIPLLNATAIEQTLVRRQIGFIFQLHNLLEFLSARQNVRMSLQLHEGTDAKGMDDKADAMLAEVGLADRGNSYPDKLSGGQRQRVSIARALVHEPKLILADEPTSALDGKTGREVVTLLSDLARQQQCAVLMVTHDHRIEDIADRVITMDDGRIIST